MEKAISSVEYSLVLKELDKIDLKSLPEKEKNIIKDSIQILEEVYYHNVAHKAFEWNESNIHSPMVSYSLFMFVREFYPCLLYTSPSPRDRTRSRMPSSA